MDRQTIEKRLKQLAGGAEMVSYKQIIQYTGRSRDWVKKQVAQAELVPVGTGHGQVFHIADVAKMLTPQ